MDFVYAGSSTVQTRQTPSLNFLLTVYKPNNSDVCYSDVQQKGIFFCHLDVVLKTTCSLVFGNIMSTDLFVTRSTHGALKLHFWDLLTGKPFSISLNSAHSGCDIAVGRHDVT